MQFLLTTTIYCGNNKKFWFFTRSSSLCLKNLPETNDYVEFDYVTQEAEQCSVDFEVIDIYTKGIYGKEGW